MSPVGNLPGVREVPFQHFASRAAHKVLQRRKQRRCCQCEFVGVTVAEVKAAR